MKRTASLLFAGFFCGAAVGIFLLPGVARALQALTWFGLTLFNYCSITSGGPL